MKGDLITFHPSELAKEHRSLLFHISQYLGYSTLIIMDVLINTIMLLEPYKVRELWVSPLK